VHADSQVVDGKEADILVSSVNLPELIAHTSMDAETVTVLRESLQDILK